MGQKILIVRFSSIGDIVLTSPVIRCVKEQTGAEIHFLTKAAFGGIFKHNPYLSRIWTIKKDLSEIIAELRAEKFSIILDLHNNLRSRQLSLHLRQSKTYRFNKLNWEKWLLTKWKINRLPKLHIVDRYLETAAALGVKNDAAGLDYHLGPEDKKVANYFNDSPPYLAFVIGAAHPTKCLTAAQMLRFCQTYQGQVVLLGGPSEKELGRSIAAQSGTNVINTCGQYTIGQSAYLLQQATAVLTHDTGLMHIAAAFHKPIVSIWGNTVADFGMYPYLPGQEAQEQTRRIEIQNLSCRPCSKIGYPQCPKGHFKCIKTIEVADILTKVASLF